MDDRKLTEKESIELISSMINRTKRRLCLGDGNIMLLWGYITVSLSALVWILLITTHNPAVNWLWFLIWIIGGTAMPRMLRKKRIEKGAVTYTDTISKNIWKIVSFAGIAMTFICLGFLLFGSKDCWSSMLVYALLFVGFAETAQGIIIQEKSLIWGGSAGLIAGAVTVCCIAAGVPLYVNWYLPMFMAAFIAMMIIPGHILNHKAKSAQ